MLRRIAHRRIWTEDSGSSAVEFAVILPVLLLFTFGIFEFGRFFWTQNQLQFAVEETARKSLTSDPTNTGGISACSTSPGNRAVVIAKLVALSVTDTEPDVTLVSAAVGNTDLTVAPKICTITVTYAFSFLGFLQLGGLTVEGVAAYPCKDSSGLGSGTTCS